MAFTSANMKEQLRKPFPRALAAAAAVGWVIVFALLVARTNMQSDVEARLLEAEESRLVLVDELDSRTQATGSLEELTATLDTTRAELEEIEGARDTARADLEAGTQQLETVRADLTETSARLEAAQTEVAPLDERLANQAALISDAEQKTLERTEELSSVGARLEEARAQEAELQQNVSQLSAEMADLAAQASDAEARVQEARSAEASLQEELNAARTELTQIADERRGLEDAVASLSERRQQLASDTAAAEGQRSSLQQEVADLSAALSARADELAVMEQRIASLQDEGDSAAAARTAGIAPGPYMSDGITAAFAADGTFTMTPEGGEEMSGTYAVADDVLTLDGVEDAPDGFSFPAECAVSFEPTGFSLDTTEASPDACPRLSGLKFEQG